MKLDNVSYHNANFRLARFLHHPVLVWIRVDGINSVASYAYVLALSRCHHNDLSQPKEKPTTTANQTIEEPQPTMKRAAKEEEDDEDYSDSSSSRPPSKRSTRDDESRKGSLKTRRADDGDQKQGAAKAKRPRRSEEEEVPLTFPQRLMEVLENEMLNNILSWLPHGRAFAIWDKRKFARDVMGRYFKQSKFTSFTRKLNRWGFERVARGPETGAYYHPLFQRNNLRLCLQMTCQGTKAHYQQKDPLDDLGTEDAATTAAATAEGRENRIGATSSTVQELTEEVRKQLSGAVPSGESFQVKDDGVSESSPCANSARQESNLLQLGRLEGVIEQTLLKHHLANRAGIDFAALGVSGQGLLDALAGTMRPPTSAPAISANLGGSLLQQMQLEELRRKLPSIPSANVATAGVGALGTAGLSGGSLSSPFSPHITEGNAASQLHHRQLEELRRMLGQQPISATGSVEAALLGNGSLGSIGLVGSSMNGLGAPGLPDSSSSGRASQGVGSFTSAQLDEVRRGLLLQQQIQHAQRSMVAAARPSLGGAASMPSTQGQRYLPSLLATQPSDPTSAILSGLLPSNASTDYLALIMAQANAQRQVRESFAMNPQSHNPQLGNRNASSQQDQLNQHVLQLIQQANARQGSGQHQDQRNADRDEEKETH